MKEELDMIQLEISMTSQHFNDHHHSNKKVVFNRFTDKTVEADWPNSMKSHFQLSLFQKLKRIFTPNIVMMSSDYVPDGFCFPQSIIAGVLISTITIAFISFQCLSYLARSTVPL
jgi:hypothetical protein